MPAGLHGRLEARPEHRQDGPLGVLLGLPMGNLPEELPQRTREKSRPSPK